MSTNWLAHPPHNTYIQCSRCDFSPGYECRAEFHQNSLLSGPRGVDISLWPGAYYDPRFTAVRIIRLPPGAAGLTYQPVHLADGGVRHLGVLFRSGAQANQHVAGLMLSDVDDSIYKFIPPALSLAPYIQGDNNAQLTFLGTNVYGDCLIPLGGCAPIGIVADYSSDQEVTDDGLQELGGHNIIGDDDGLAQAGFPGRRRTLLLTRSLHAPAHVFSAEIPSWAGDVDVDVTTDHLHAPRVSTSSSITGEQRRLAATVSPRESYAILYAATRASLSAATPRSLQSTSAGTSTTETPSTSTTETDSTTSTSSTTDITTDTTDKHSIGKIVKAIKKEIKSPCKVVKKNVWHTHM